MAIKSPEQLDTVKTQAMPTVRTQGVAQEAMSTNFLNNIAKTADTLISAQTAADKKMVSIISNRYRELADQERIKSEAVVTSTQGWNVLKTSKEQSTALTESLSKLKGQFDEKYEPYLENVRLDVLNKYQRSSQPYVINQVKKTTNDTFNAVLSNEMNDTILNSGDLDAFSTNLDRIRSIVREKSAVQRGEDGEVEVAPGMKLSQLIEKEEGVAVSKTVANSVIQLSNVGHLKNAEELFRKHDADMNADDRLRAIEAMKRAQNSEENNAAIAAADLIQKSANDLVEAERMASDMAGTTKQRSAIMAILNSRYEVATKAAKKKEDDTTATIYDNLAQGKTLDEVNPLLRSVSVERQNEIITTLNKNGGKVIPSVTNNQKFDEAITKVYTDPDVLEDPGFLSRYVPFLSPSDYSFVKGQLNTRKRQAADSQEWNRLNTNKIVLEDVILFNNERGIFDPSAISKNKRIAIEFADSLLTSNPKMDRNALKKQVKAFLFTNSATPEKTPRGVISRTWNALFGDGLDYEINYKNPQVPDAINAEGKAVSYSNEDKEEFRRTAIEAFNKAGKKADPLAIEKALNERMRTGKSLKFQ